MSIKNIFNTQISTNNQGKSFILLFTGNVPSNVFFLAEQNFSLLGGHFGHLSKNILYTRPVQRAHTQKSVKLLTLMCYLYLI